jgi:GNAT superfamily N-acetyltransferase
VRFTPARAAAAAGGSGGGADAVLRRGLAADLPLVRAAAWRERMNPLSLNDARRFTVAVDASTGEPLGWGQLVPINAAATARDAAEAGGATPAASTSAADEAPIYELRTLQVQPQARGNGLGAQLVAALKERAGPGSRLYLTTVGVRVPFYERSGFVELSPADMPGFILGEWAVGSAVTRLLGGDRCAVLVSAGRGGLKDSL